MAIEVLFFGQLTDITGTDSMSIEQLHDTDALKKMLNTMYPQLENAKYIFAVNNTMVHANTILNNDARVALLPPFSGG